MINASLNTFNLPEALAGKPTPFHVYFRAHALEDARALERGIREHLPGAALSYSVKTNPLVCLLKDLASIGWEMQALTEADMHAAQRAGVKAAKITLGGNAWTEASLRAALMEGKVRKMVVDSTSQADLLATVLKKNSISLDAIYLRINDRNSHFGMSANQVKECLSKLTTKAAAVFGLHLHVNPPGSPGSATDVGADFRTRAKTLLDATRALGAEASLPRISALNLGGGVDSPYVYRPHPHEFARFHNPHEVAELRGAKEGHQRFNLEEVGQTIGKAVSEELAGEDFALTFEPGRAACTRSLSTVLSIRAVKDDLYPDARVYVTDGNTALLGPIHRGIHPLKLERAHSGKKRNCFVYGNLPHSGDWLYQSLSLPELSLGERVMVVHTGAYYLSCEANFSEPRPAIYDAESGATVRKPELVADLSARDIP